MLESEEQPEFDPAFVAQVLDATPDAFLVVDPEGHIRWANPAAERMFGYPRDELVGGSLERLIPARARAGHAAWVRDFASGGSARPMGRGLPLSAVCKDGRELPVDVALSPLETTGGRFVLATVRDVSDRVAAAEAVVRSERRLRELLEHAPDAVVVVDREGRYTEVSPAASRLLGYAREELLGKTPADITAPIDASRVDDMRARLIADGVETGELTLRRKDGSEVPVEFTASVLADGGRQAFLRDVTERKRAEEALRKSERAQQQAAAELEAILEECPVGVIIARRPEAPDYAPNQAARAILGEFDPGVGLLGRLCDAEGEPVPIDRYPLVRALRGESTEGESYVFDRQPGGTTPVEVSACPVRDDAGRITSAVLVVQDLTLAKELERLRAEWGAIVAHDLRQPMNTIHLRVQMLQKQAASFPEASRRHLAEIKTLVLRLARMTTDLMDLSRLDARRLALVEKPVDVASCVRDCAERLSLEHPDRPVEVEVSDGDATTVGDVDRLSQVFENLLSNAYKYGSEDHPVRVRVEVLGDELRVSVTNHGHGLSQADLDRLFRRFHRAGVTAHQAIPGVGLGLQIAQGLVEAHGGTLRAESVPDGETTFTVTLPRRGV